MELRLYQVDAFTDHLFGGNPAAVVPLKEWLPTELMQQISMETNLSDTAFFVTSDSPGIDFDIRWFTPAVEINLCGHATLAASWILFNKLGFDRPQIVFNSNSGLLKVSRNGDRIDLDFPSWRPAPLTAYHPQLQQALGGANIVEVHQQRDLLVVLENEAAVQQCQPDLTLMRSLYDKVIITAKGDQVDFVSRFFAPGAGINEDPVTGSAHSQLIPYWSERLNKKEMVARQLSHRGGILYCQQSNAERVAIGGYCVFFMEGIFHC